MGPARPSTCVKNYFVASSLTQPETWEPAGPCHALRPPDPAPCSWVLPFPYQGLPFKWAILLTSKPLFFKARTTTGEAAVN